MRYGHISERLIAKAEVELAKYGYHWALASGKRVRARAMPRGGIPRVAVPGDVKAAYRRGELRPGDLVEGEAMLSPFAAIYRPRAYYPEYLLGQMPAALTGEVVPISPRLRPVVTMPPLTDGTAGIAFLYPREKRAVERSAFPGDLREALTRDYDQVPLLLTPEAEGWMGPCVFRARLQRLNDADALKLGGVAGPLYGTMEERGLTLFLSAEDEDCSVEPLAPAEPERLAGSLFLEARIAGEKADAHLREALMEELTGAVRGVWGSAAAQGEETRVMTRLLALVHGPIIAIQRAPHLLSLFMPCDLTGDLPACAADFEAFVGVLFTGLRCNIEGHGHDLNAEIDFAYDCRRPFFVERRAMRTDLLDAVLHRKPHLVPVRDWLTGPGTV